MRSTCHFFQRKKQIVIPLQDLSGSPDSIESGIVTPYQPIPETHNQFVYKTTHIAGYLSLATLLPYAYFTFCFALNGMVMIGMTAAKKTSVSESTMTSLAILPAGILTTFDSIANVTLVDFKTAALNWSKALPDGFMAGTAHHIKKMFRSPKAFFTVGIPTLAMAISYPIGGHANGVLLKQPLEEQIGTWCWAPLATLAFLSALYFVITQGQDNLRGVKFYLNEGKQRLMPAQNSIAHHLLFGNLDLKATAFQCAAFEMLPGNISRAIAGGYMAGKLAEQLNFSTAALRTAELSMMFISLFGYYFARAPLAYKKFFGKREEPLYLVTQAERDRMYEENDANMSWMPFIKKEFLRFTLPLPAAESLLAFYLGSLLPIPYMTPMITGATAALLFYTQIYRRAYRTLELNQLALKHPVINARIIEVINSQNPTLPTTQSASHQELHRIAIFFAQLIAFLAWAARSLGSVPMTNSIINNYFTLEEWDALLISIALGTVTAINGYQYFFYKISQTLNSWIIKITEHQNQTSNASLVIEEVNEPTHTVDIDATPTQTPPRNAIYPVSTISIFPPPPPPNHSEAPRPRRTSFACGVM